MNFTDTDCINDVNEMHDIRHHIANWKVRDQVYSVAEDICEQILPIQAKFHQEIET